MKSSNEMLNFIRSDDMKSIVDTYYNKDYTQQEFEKLLLEFIPDKTKHLFHVNDSLEWKYTDPPADNNLLKTMSKTLYTVLAVRNHLIKYFQQPKPKPIIPCSIIHPTVHSSTSTSNLNVQLPEFLKEFLFRPDELDSPYDITWPSDASRLNRYSIEIIVAYALYYHIYSKLDPSEKFFRIGSNDVGIKLVGHSIIESCVDDTRLYPFEEERLKEMFNIESIPDSLISEKYTGDAQLFEDMLDFGLNEHQKILEALRKISTKVDKMMNDSTLYEEIILKHYNQYGVESFGVILGVVLGLIYGGASTTVKINIIRVVDLLPYPCSLQPPTSMLGYDIKDFYNYIFKNKKSDTFETYANYLKANHDKIDELYLNMAKSVSNNGPDDFINCCIDWFIKNRFNSEFFLCMNYVQDPPWQFKYYMKPVIITETLSHKNKFNHITWMPESCKSVKKSGNCVLYSYFLRFLIDDTLIKTCSEKYKWIFIPFNELRFNDSIEKLNELFPLVIQSFVEDYDSLFERCWDFLLESEFNGQKLTKTITESFDNKFENIVEQYIKKAGPRYDSGHIGNCKDVVFISVSPSTDLLKTGFNACSKMCIINILFQRLLKSSLGTSKIKSIGIGNAHTNECFKDFNTIQKESDEGYHARVLYRLDIDLNLASDLIKDDYDETKKFVSDWLIANHYADKNNAFDKIVDDLLIYIALFCVYKHINEIKGHENLNKITMDSKITEADFIASKDIKDWINASAPGCKFMTEKKMKPEYLDMFYISFYLFKFMNVSNIWCIIDINEYNLINTTFINELLGLTGTITFRLNHLTVLDNKESIDINEIYRIIGKFDVERMAKITGGKNSYSLLLVIELMVLFMFIISVIVYVVYKYLNNVKNNNALIDVHL